MQIGARAALDGAQPLLLVGIGHGADRLTAILSKHAAERPRVLENRVREQSFSDFGALSLEQESAAF